MAVTRIVLVLEQNLLGVLHSTPMAQRMCERIGFRVDAPFGVFTPPNALHC